MKKTITLVFSTLLLSPAILAQSPVFSAGNTSYVHLTGATRVAADSVWDDPKDWTTQLQTIPLGFTFTTFKKSFTNVKWEQGAVFFQDLDTVYYFGLHYVDMCDYGLGTGNPKSPLWIKTEGSAGNRIVKLEWQSFGFWDDWSNNGSCKDSGNVQLWIHESEQKIELRFGKSTITNFSALFPEGAMVTCARYDGIGITDGIKLDGNPVNPDVYEFKDTNIRALQSWPVNGTIYTFLFGIAGTEDVLRERSTMYYFEGKLMLTGHEKSKEIEIYQSSGALLFRDNFENGVYDLASIKPGIYLARLSDDTGGQFLRFIKTD